MDDQATLRRVGIDVRTWSGDRDVTAVQSQIGGCEAMVFVPSRELRLRLIERLNTCEKHDGSHHFAVVGEGRTIAMSLTGVVCVADIIMENTRWAGLLNGFE